MGKSHYQLILNHTVTVTRRSGFTVTAMGQRRSSGETTMVENMSVFFQHLTGEQIMRLQGNWRGAEYQMYVGGTIDIQEGDLVYPVSGVVGLTLGKVMMVEPIMDFDGLTHHVETLIGKIG